MLARALDAAVDAGAEGVLPAFIEAVEGWHPLQIVTGYWLHEAIRSALRLGKYDPSDCTLTQCQRTVCDSNVCRGRGPALARVAPAPCPTTQKLVRLMTSLYCRRTPYPVSSSSLPCPSTIF